MPEKLMVFREGERLLTLNQGVPVLWFVTADGMIEQEPLLWTDKLIQ